MSTVTSTAPRKAKLRVNSSVLPTTRHPARLVTAALVLVLSSMLAVAIYTQVGDRTQVLALVHDVEQGNTITNQDLKVVDVATDRAASALANYREALKIREQLSSAAASDLYLRRDLAEVLLKTGDALALSADKSQAVEDYRRALRMLEALAQSIPSDVEIRDMLAQARAKGGAPN